MKIIKAKKEFTSQDRYFYEGKEISISEIKEFKELVYWNEKGFIEPLERKDLMEIKEKLENLKRNFKEEE